MHFIKAYFYIVIVAFLQNATIEYSSESLCACVYLFYLFIKIYLNRVFHSAFVDAVFKWSPVNT